MMMQWKNKNYLLRLSDRVIVDFTVVEAAFSSVELEEILLELMSRRSDKSSTEVRWADKRWYIEGSFLGLLKKKNSNWYFDIFMLA